MNRKRILRVLFAILFFVSLSVNGYFIFKRIDYARLEDEKGKLLFIKKISHQEGLLSFKERIKSDFPYINLENKKPVVYFWDTTSYDFLKKDGMKELDSMATKFGQYSFNYFFVTDMETEQATNFLNRHKVHFDNFKVIGEMNDFMSGIYNEKPIKWKKLNDPTIEDGVCKPISQIKLKPCYFIMDTNGKILYYSYKPTLPIKDPFLIKNLNNFSTKTTDLKE